MTTADAITPMETVTAYGDVRQLNTQLLQTLVSAFTQNPEADLAAYLPSDYNSHFPRRLALGGNKRKPESKLVQLNRRTIDTLLQQYAFDPAGSLTGGTGFPLMYGAEYSQPMIKAKAVKIKLPAERPPDHFASMLDRVNATSLVIVAPLSPEVNAILQQQGYDDAKDPVGTLKTVIKKSCFLWSGTAGGRFVAKISDDIAVRVTCGEQANHYAASEFLAEHAPDIPAPRPHGLIQIGELSVMFFSYVPGVTLETAWPALSHQHKTSIQTELDHIFTRIRKIPRDGRPMGMVSGEGVVDMRALSREYRPVKPPKTVAEFEEFVFTYRPWVSKTYVRFLQQLLPESRFDEPCVFTHGDLRPANIMVDPNEIGDWMVTGIIDWEEAGFYPAYWESVAATRTFLPSDESDWYLMLPASISPTRYPKQWLVDWLWESLIARLGPMDKRAREAKKRAEDDH